MLTAHQMRYVFLLIILIPYLGVSQTVCSLESKERLVQLMTELSKKDLSGDSMNSLHVEIGKWFLGTPYVEKTLELPGEEKLVINLQGLDCTTYLETVVALGQLAKNGNFTFDKYEASLEKLRYRNGMNTGYPSRLHYFSDWIYDNQTKGILKDISAEIGGKIYVNQPSFMSTNPQFYPQLSNDNYVIQIKEAEKEIAGRKYHYIPKDEISQIEHLIQSGDLIAITASMASLDMVHVGFAIERNGRIHLMHASTGSMEVEISEKPLSDYLAGSKSQSGIMVARAL
jgi:hypothetical protein